MTHNKPKHEVGEKKEVIQFAFLPMIIESRFVWFRKYKSIKRYVKEFVWDDFDHQCNTEYYWLTIERKLIR